MAAVDDKNVPSIFSSHEGICSIGNPALSKYTLHKSSLHKTRKLVTDRQDAQVSLPNTIHMKVHTAGTVGKIFSSFRVFQSKVSCM